MSTNGGGGHRDVPAPRRLPVTNFPLHNAGLTSAEQSGSYAEYLGPFIASRPAGGVKWGGRERTRALGAQAKWQGRPVEPAVGHARDTGSPSRRRRALALSTVAGIVLLAGWVPGQAHAATAAAGLPIPSGGCGAPPAATTMAAAYAPGTRAGAPTAELAAAFSLVAPNAGADADPTPTPSEADPTPTPSDADPTPTPSQPSPTPTPSEASPTPTPSQAAPTPTPTPSQAPSPAGPTPTKTPSPGKTSSNPNPSGSPSPGGAKTPTLCAEVQAPTSGVGPGTTDSFLIWVWAIGAEASAVSVTADTVAIPGVGVPQFTICPAPGGSVCNLGDLPAGRAEELAANVSVASSVAPGNEVTLIATVRGTQASSDQAEVSAIVAAGAGTPGSGEISPDLPGSLVSLPGYAGSTGSVSDLFPTVNPGTGAPARASSPGGRRNPGAEAATVSDILPLNGRLIGGQLAGLAVLVCALAAAVLRLSIRRAQS